jgi:hypothetical protein
MDLGRLATVLEIAGENTRHWKDHLKNDRRSDQDHRLKLDGRSDQKKKSSKIRSYNIFCPQSHLSEGHFLNFLIKHF